MSFDVVSLYTKILVEKTIEVAKNGLLKDETLPDRIQLSPDEVGIYFAFV